MVFFLFYQERQSTRGQEVHHTCRKLGPGHPSFVKALCALQKSMLNTQTFHMPYSGAFLPCPFLAQNLRHFPSHLEYDPLLLLRPAAMTKNTQRKLLPQPPPFPNTRVRQSQSQLSPPRLWTSIPCGRFRPVSRRLSYLNSAARMFLTPPAGLGRQQPKSAADLVSPLVLRGHSPTPPTLRRLRCGHPQRPWRIPQVAGLLSRLRTRCHSTHRTP
mmetsp:Transcript_14751/g.22941  ORF Transcript_14751/g.22941 Transcript_14751/m.22941 type:complete len:215 (+) Transcript_14751:286-930(+)